MAEKNLTFKEAKAKGLVAPNAIAEQEVMKLAGGADVFKPESWWNQQLTKQIDAKDFKEISGYRTEVYQPSFMGGGGTWQPQTGIGGMGGRYGLFGEKPITRQVPIYKDVTADVFNKIKAQSKSQVEVTQRESGQRAASSKRVSRATGGLLAGAQMTSSNDLGAGTMLGSGSSLGTGQTLGRRTRI